jgi:hypothetical protein
MGRTLFLRLDPLFGLADQIHQTGGFVGRGRADQRLELFCCKLFFKITHDIELLPPAIQDFETGALVVTANAAVIKAYRVF